MEKKNNGLSIIQLEERFEMVVAADRKREVHITIGSSEETVVVEENLLE